VRCRRSTPRSTRRQRSPSSARAPLLWSSSHDDGVSDKRFINTIRTSFSCLVRRCGKQSIHCVSLFRRCVNRQQTNDQQRAHVPVARMRVCVSASFSKSAAYVGQRMAPTSSIRNDNSVVFVDSVASGRDIDERQRTNDSRRWFRTTIGARQRDFGQRIHHRQHDAQQSQRRSLQRKPTVVRMNGVSVQLS
jgi:hypothetical protein